MGASASRARRGEIGARSGDGRERRGDSAGDYAGAACSGGLALSEAVAVLQEAEAQKGPGWPRPDGETGLVDRSGDSRRLFSNTPGETS